MYKIEELYKQCIDDIIFATNHMGEYAHYPIISEVMRAHKYFGQSIAIFELIEDYLTVEQRTNWVQWKHTYNQIRKVAVSNI